MERIDRERAYRAYRLGKTLGLLNVTAVPAVLAALYYLIRRNGTPAHTLGPVASLLFAAVLFFETLAFFWLRAYQFPSAVRAIAAKRTPGTSSSAERVVQVDTIVIYALCEVFFLLGFVLAFTGGSLWVSSGFALWGWVLAFAFGPNWNYWEDLIDRSEAEVFAGPAPAQDEPARDSSGW